MEARCFSEVDWPPSSRDLPVFDNDWVSGVDNQANFMIYHLIHCHVIIIIRTTSRPILLKANGQACGVSTPPATIHYLYGTLLGLSSDYLH